MQEPTGRDIAALFDKGVITPQEAHHMIGGYLPKGDTVEVTRLKQALQDRGDEIGKMQSQIDRLEGYMRQIEGANGLSVAQNLASAALKRGE